MPRLTIGALLLIAGPALAEENPPALPTNDVDVTYVMPMQAGAARQRLRFSAAHGLLRLDPPGGGLFIVIDTMAGRMYTVRAADRSVIGMAAPRSWMPGLGAATYVRRNPDVVAGTACTDWETKDSEGRPVRACITADGVMLRAALGARVLVVATELRHEPQAAPLFQVPQNYRRLAPPPIPDAQ